MRLVEYVRRVLGPGVRAVLDPFAIPEGLEVLPCDWVAAGNSLRRILNMEPYQGQPRYPTIEEMEAWEHAFPGMAAQWRRCARIEAEIRWLRGQRRGT